MEAAERKTGKDIAELSGPDLPHEAAHLWEWLLDAGPVASYAEGPACLGYADLAAWASLRDMAVTPWEAGLLRQASAVYLGEVERGRKTATPPGGGISDDKRQAVATALKQAFGGLARQGKKGLRSMPKIKPTEGDAG